MNVLLFKIKNLISNLGPIRYHQSCLRNFHFYRVNYSTKICDLNVFWASKCILRTNSDITNPKCKCIPKMWIVVPQYHIPEVTNVNPSSWTLFPSDGGGVHDAVPEVDWLREPEHRRSVRRRSAARCHCHSFDYSRLITGNQLVN